MSDNFTLKGSQQDLIDPLQVLWYQLFVILHLIHTYPHHILIKLYYQTCFNPYNLWIRLRLNSFSGTKSKPKSDKSWENYSSPSTKNKRKTPSNSMSSKEISQLSPKEFRIMISYSIDKIAKNRHTYNFKTKKYKKSKRIKYSPCSNQTPDSRKCKPSSQSMKKKSVN